MPSPVKGNLLVTFRRFRRFPLLLAPAGLLNTAALQAPVLIMSHAYGVGTAGVLALTQRLLALPMIILGQSVAQIYIGEVSRLMHSDTRAALRLFQKTSRALIVVALIVVALVFAASPLLAPLLGYQWRQAGSFARALSLAVAAQLVVSPVSQTIILLGRAWLQLVWDGARLFASAGSMMVAIVSHASALQCLWAYSIVTSGMYLCFWIVTRAALVRAGARPHAAVASPKPD
jgi:O-antigen/teichoic acid export membrane protein